MAIKNKIKIKIENRKPHTVDKQVYNPASATNRKQNLSGIKKINSY
jgi:hypothetical protein